MKNVEPVIFCCAFGIFFLYTDIVSIPGWIFIAIGIAIAVDGFTNGRSSTPSRGRCKESAPSHNHYDNSSSNSDSSSGDSSSGD